MEKEEWAEKLSRILDDRELIGKEEDSNKQRMEAYLGRYQLDLERYLPDSRFSQRIEVNLSSVDLRVLGKFEN